MLLTAVHMDSSSTTTSPPWLPVLTDHHLLTPASASNSSSPSTPPPPSSSSRHHSLLRPAPAARHRRVVAKRRPRPPPHRRLPTTYISAADPASFRRMVHQVTGTAADDDKPQSLPLVPRAPDNAPAVRAAAAAGGGGSSTEPGGALINMHMILPTLDTSAAFLVSPTTRTDASSRDGPAAAPAPDPAFPTLESWDHHHALF